ncbi:5-oxoprolinase subunit PxpB [Achromobacter anxifer]|uniref:5-oxoprolinase subunit PxpB n=1 Tax=Achromobacter anxifer TaxID=1287737 RepID=UPI00155C8BA6|nr:5-oxoprolinase subunit PxpB [Achromobacter anxifer]MDF8361654.1 5-oxoprolinase subunit PxpB [Achromobacter anxifer]CAB5515193.1 5-oxoprolinase subunit B [Achromobacter anxifer]
MNAISEPPSPAETSWRILPQGDRCLIVSFGDQIDAAVGRTCLASAGKLRDARLPGVTDVVPSFVAVAVHYRPGASGGPTYAQLSERIRQLLSEGIAADALGGREIDIPVCYGGEHGPDLAEVAEAAGLTPDDVIRLHSQPRSMVFMLGFAPGHAYLGVHDERLNIPRRPSPRTAVPPGAVAVANRQTVIYPSRLPGGWNIIGATPLTMFDPAREPAALLQPGDSVRFVPISAAEFERIRGART